jgi:hypothetical protein
MNLDQPPKPNQEQAFYKSLVAGKTRFTIEGQEKIYSGVAEDGKLQFSNTAGEVDGIEARDFFEMNQGGTASKIFEIVPKEAKTGELIPQGRTRDESYQEDHPGYTAELVEDSWGGPSGEEISDAEYTEQAQEDTAHEDFNKSISQNQEKSKQPLKFEI